MHVQRGRMDGWMDGWMADVSEGRDPYLMSEASARVHALDTCSAYTSFFEVGCPTKPWVQFFTCGEVRARRSRDDNRTSCLI